MSTCANILTRTISLSHRITESLEFCFAFPDIFMNRDSFHLVS